MIYNETAWKIVSKIVKPFLTYDFQSNRVVFEIGNCQKIEKPTQIILTYDLQ